MPVSTRQNQSKNRMGIKFQKSLLLIAYFILLSSFNSNKDFPLLQPIAKEEFKYISSKFGWRNHPIREDYHFHSGIDIVTKHKNTKVFVTADGLVKELDYSKEGLGLYLVIEHANDFETVYAHLSDIKVLKGSKVKAGDCIGRVGDTGSSTAEHLHYEIHHEGIALDPIEIVKRLKKK